MRRTFTMIAIAVPLVGCIQDERGDMGAAGSIGATGATGAEDGEGPGSGDDGGGDDDILLDVLPDDEGEIPCGEGGDCDAECEVPEHVACDANGDDPMQALGLDCPGELQIGGQINGSKEAWGVVSGLGSTSQWDPTEGSAALVIGTGRVAELSAETPPNDVAAAPTYCNDDLGPTVDKGTSLPAPIRPFDVPGDCDKDPSLIGMGDCSNSVAKQFNQGVSANDYVEVRIETTVPMGAESFSYDLAFFSTEYPFYYFSEFNDMYVGWVESTRWTGNVSFDEFGNPISLNASFLDFKDKSSDLPELAGTCMRGHAGTKWLTTTAPVEPGEKITLVFAIFDLSDSILDSYVLLDDFRWGCEGDQPPSTVPQG